MLQHAGLVRHVAQVIEFERRQFARTFVERFDREAGRCEMAAFGSGAFKTLHVASRHLRPDHLPPEQIGPLAHGVALGLVVQQVNHLLGQRRRIAERHQRSPFFGQHLFRVPIRRRNHGLARAQGIGQRAGGDLRRVEIGRDVNVRRADELDEFLQTDKAVVENHLPSTPFSWASHCRDSRYVSPSCRYDVRMGRAEDDVHHVRMLRQNSGQGGDDIFDPFVRREQAKTEQDDFALDAEQVFVKTRIHKGHIGDAVRDQIDLLRRHADRPSCRNSAPRSLMTTNRSEGPRLLSNTSSLSGRVAQNGVQGRDDRHAQFTQESQNVAARPPAENAILVLQADDIHVVIFRKSAARR